MRGGKHRKTQGKVDRTSRTVKQYFAESVWAYGVGVVAANWTP